MELVTLKEMQSIMNSFILDTIKTAYGAQQVGPNILSYYHGRVATNRVLITRRPPARKWLKIR